MTAHTPGPKAWVGSLYPPNREWLNRCLGGLVMKPHCCADMKLYRETDTPICALHTAAPELLEALETAMMDLNTIVDHVRVSSERRTADLQTYGYARVILSTAFGMQKNFRAAIAKAKGETA